MTTRQAYSAGSFYDASPPQCRTAAADLLAAAAVPDDIPDVLYGGLVPHAGWSYSGALAALTFKALCAAGDVDTVVLFGADHFGTVQRGEVYPTGAWETPLGEVTVDEELAAAIIAAGAPFRANPAAHDYHATYRRAEHSIEVQLPLLKAVAPEAKIVPIAVPPTRLAVEIGQAVADVLARAPGRTAVVGSTDLTHHAGHFPAPGGRGEVGEQWACANDRRMLDLIEAMDDARTIDEAATHANACGAGAITAAIAACKRLGATRGLCLQYTNSYQVVRADHPHYDDDTTVGYASVVFA